MKIPLPDEVKVLIEDVPKNMASFAEGIEGIKEKLDKVICLLEEIRDQLKEK